MFRTRDGTAVLRPSWFELLERRHGCLGGDLSVRLRDGEVREVEWSYHVAESCKENPGDDLEERGEIWQRTDGGTFQRTWVEHLVPFKKSSNVMRGRDVDVRVTLLDHEDQDTIEDAKTFDDGGWCGHEVWRYTQSRQWAIRRRGGSWIELGPTLEERNSRTSCVDWAGQP